MIKRFLDYIAIEKRYSPRTVKEYGDDLRAWCAYLGWDLEDFDPTQLDADDVKGWMMQICPMLLPTILFQIQNV